ncbi:aldehyde dehydrogenase (NADP(+)) [Psychrobium sp. nBUS_13]|uniref:aldehyde dehydrogenase (NADP(+)) n=1 Tax=Psychrobium sp. nBUS_13 TaxID=3395319 RepID=UPI003EC00394
MIEITGKHLINGQWVNSTTATFASANPSTDDVNPWTFFEASADDADSAVASANDAFRQYRRKSAAQRAALLNAIASEIENLGEQLVHAAMSETALPQMRIEGERGRTCGQLRAFANNLLNPISPVFIDHAQPERQPLPKGDSRLTNTPLGPVVVFGASNFPLAFSTAGGDTASALAAGCSVIVKGHPAHPATTELVSHAIQRAIDICDMPAGVFNMVQSTTPQVAQQLVQHPQVKAVGFTGSQKVGDILNKLTQERPIAIPFFGELGSTNPQFILPQKLASDAQSLANNQVASMLMGHGQFCTSPGLVIVQNSDGLEGYLATLANAISESSAGTMLTKGIAQTYNRQVDLLLSNPSLTHIASGGASSGDCQSSANAFSVSASDFIAQPALQEEVFGPCALVVICDNDEQMGEFALSLTGQLTASVFGSDDELLDYIDLVDDIAQSVGRLMFNQLPTGVEVCHSMQHGGPYPASTAPQTTSVGSQAINRFTRPICLQNMPIALQPEEIKDGATNPQVIV